MTISCYCHAVSAIQIKNVPPELHERLRERARREGRNLSEYTLDVLERDLALPTTREWLERLREDEPVPDITSEEIVSLIHEGRAERDEQILRAISDGD
jgi:plasmid stability protein